VILTSNDGPEHTETQPVSHLILLSFSMLLPAITQDAPTSATPKVHKIAVGGEGGWDYLTVDSAARRLYVSRGNRVTVLDIDREDVVGELADTPGVHGIAVVPELGKGFTSNGRDSSVTVFDLKTLRPTNKIKARGVPDAILYDPSSKRVITFNHGTNDGTSIDPASEKVAGTIDFRGEPEAAVADGRGHIFVNIRSSSEVLEFDALSLKILNRWPLAPGRRPNGLAIDAKNRRLFSGCNGNSKMVVMDADKGTVITTVDIGRGSDGCGFDPVKGLAYSSNGGDGTVTIIGEPEPGKFKVVATVPTQTTARTMTIDPKTHRLYLSAATPVPAPPGAQTKGGRRGNAPGSFVIVVVGD
jgi:WD40 repeat protein